MQIGKSYFYPRPPRGGRPPSAKIKNNCAYFYPRPPRGGRPGDGSEVTLTLRFLSTPSARRATPPKLADMLRVYLFLSTPSARRATWSLMVTHLFRLFLSTPSARRATRSCPPAMCGASYFYPRPPRGGRPDAVGLPRHDGLFLSTPSARRATCRTSSLPADQRISIHALREEGDQPTITDKSLPAHFYPRPPRGGRLPVCGPVH